jgi:hypothetical protein
MLFGIDTGNQVSFGKGDNNNAPAGYFASRQPVWPAAGSPSPSGARWPEDPVRALGNRANSAQRFWNDLSG